MTIDTLVHAMQSLTGDDAFRARLSLEQWRSVAAYMARGDLRAGERLVHVGDTDRTLWFLAQGTLQVYGDGPPGPEQPRLAILRAGAVVGEASLFAERARSAHVEAMTACSVWALRSTRLDELAQRMPAVACEILRAAGAVLAVRLPALLARQMPLV
jgi:CRP/FNR family cyclic AMP-dependent transcriptional regulator